MKALALDKLLKMVTHGAVYSTAFIHFAGRLAEALTAAKKAQT